MENDIKVSAFCSAYNHEKYIRKTLEGFVNQKTDFAYEVIVHDDASTDGTAAIIREYAEKYPDIIIPILQTENQFGKGVLYEKEFILPRMRGKYIAVCEGDDYWTSPNKLQKQADILDAHPECTLVAHNTVKITADGDPMDLMVANTESGYLSPADLINKNDKNPHLSSLMYRIEMRKERPEFFQLTTGDNAIRLFSLAKGKVYYINEVMSAYRVFTPNGWTSQQRASREARIQTGKNMLLFLEKYDAYTDGQYHDVVERERLKREYSLKLAERDYAAAYALSKKRNTPIKLRMGLFLLSKSSLLRKLRETVRRKNG